MVRNYYTLLKLSEEFQSLIGLKIAECYIQDKNTVIFNLYNGIDSVFINFIHSSPFDSIYLTNRCNRANNNSTDILEKISGDTIQKVEIIQNKRIIKMTLIHSVVYFLVFGGRESNIIVTNFKKNVIDSFIKIEDNSEFLKINDIHKIADDLNSEFQTVREFLINHYLFSRDYIKLICSSLQINQDIVMNMLDTQTKSTIINKADLLKNELINSNKYLLLINKSKQFRFSLIELDNYEIFAEYDSVSLAIQKRIIKSTIELKFNSEFTAVSNFLNKIKNKNSKTLAIYYNEDEINSRINQYKNFAELLISTQTPNRKGIKNLNTTDWEGNEIIIPIDEKLTLIENANKYFSKVKSTNEELKVRRKRIPELEQKLEKAIIALNELKKVTTLKELDNFKNNLKIKIGSKMKEEITPIEDKFRKFDLGEGYYLYVGKNASNNDELTMKFAKPNDLWMHARGSSGSHTVLKSPNNDKIPKQILLKAAEITAYYSGARNAKYTPVCYTQKKYVRKPKGANIGAVVISKEDVIMAEPKLPNE